jgi:hypothetical protein
MLSAGSHYHSTALAAAGDDGTFGHSGSVYGEAIGGTPNVTMSVANTSYNGEHTHSISETGSTETRPKNVALIYIIKAK